ncbi:MAG TPA: alpha/beta hydrolase [Nitrososphaeraceae archaeon]|nr:alpha/beta hydrolase [Nitrososphaeraceae archaeon]
MAEKSNRSFQFPFYFVAIFLTILVITVIIFSSLTLNMNQSAIAEQHQQPSFNEDASFDIGNVTFSHNMVSVNGIQLHYVTGGQGDPIVLLHGWPETWYEWRHIMPALAKNYTVIAPDLRGLGDSSKPLTGYDGKTVAEDIHQLVTQLGFKTIFLVGHDIGTQVAYSYAAAHPTEVKKLVVMDLTIPGFEPPGMMPIWWRSFHQTPDVPEALVQGKEMMYLSWFYRNLAYNPSALTQTDINEFVSHYSAPGGMRAGFEYYRAFPEDAIQNINYSNTKLTMPVLALGAGYIPAFGGNITMPTIVYGMQKLAENATGITVPNSGHWIPEERPDFVLGQLSKFFGNSLNDSK